MEHITSKPTKTCHVVAIPYPGRGHINPVMNLCKILATKEPNLLLTFVVTQEWLEVLKTEPKPDNIKLASIPNVLPSQEERVRNPDAFYEAVSTKMEAPFEGVLDQLEPEPSLVLADVSLVWPVGLGNRKGVPVASFFTMSAMMFSVCRNFHLLEKNGHFPVDLTVNGEELVDYIPGVSPTRLQEFPSFISGGFPCILRRLLESFSWLPKAQYLLISTIYELEPQTVDILKKEESLPPLYTVGPTIRYEELRSNPSSNSIKQGVDYFSWLENKPKESVLYISLGTYLPVSKEQTEELVTGLRDSGVQFLWEACGATNELEKVCGDSGLVVPWCDQLNVLTHYSIGGFLSYCSWNYVEECVFAGVPVLTFPTGAEQASNSKLLVDDWKIGCRMRKDMKPGALVKRAEVCELVTRIMDLGSKEGRELKERARELKKICHSAISDGGSSETNISSFLRSILFGGVSKFI